MTQQWKPIESAPKDGTPVLGFWTGGPAAVVSGRAYGATMMRNGAWVSVDDTDDIYTAPTHWMPLPAAPGTPPASAQDDAKDDILRWIMREAEAAKEPCGDNPESATAVRNAKLAAISGAAAQALGLVRGPSYAAPAAGDARDAVRYRTWRDAMVAEDTEFRLTVAAALPSEVGDTRPPTSAEWDAGIDAAIAAQQGKGAVA